VADSPERQTTEKFDVRRALFLSRLVRVWDKVPSLRLGELVALSLDMNASSGGFDIEVLKNIDDMELVERIERWALHKSAE
jgi:hypothetical protein